MKEISSATSQSDDGRWQVVVMTHQDAAQPYVEAWVRRPTRLPITGKVVRVLISEINPEPKSTLEFHVAIEQAKVVALKKLVLAMASSRKRSKP